jgi:hypothetical protein
MVVVEEVEGAVQFLDPCKRVFPSGQENYEDSEHDRTHLVLLKEHQKFLLSFCVAKRKPRHVEDKFQRSEPRNT